MTPFSRRAVGRARAVRTAVQAAAGAGVAVGGRGGGPSFGFARGEAERARRFESAR